MEQEIELILARAADLRLTETELREAAGISVARYWRAKTERVGRNARIKVLRDLERALDRLEAEKVA